MNMTEHMIRCHLAYLGYDDLDIEDMLGERADALMQAQEDLELEEEKS